jgi:hypothetical protein
MSFVQSEEPSVSNIIVLKRQQWTDHLQRVTGERMERRPVRRVNAVEVDTAEILGARNWRRESHKAGLEGAFEGGQVLPSACCVIEEEEEGGRGEGGKE